MPWVTSSATYARSIGYANYNALEARFQHKMSNGLSSLLSYTWSKSFDQASSFEGILNPIDPHKTYSLSQFDSRHRFVFSYVWDLPVLKYTGAKEKILNGWQMSGIISFQSGFPIRITSSADNELMNSFDFELPGEPLQLAPFRTRDPHAAGCAPETGPTDPTGSGAACDPVSNQYFDPNIFTENAEAFPQILGTIPNTELYQSLSHSKWDCKYHVVFVPKRRRKAIFGQTRRHLGQILHALARQKECQIPEGHLMPDHVHMCIAIPPKGRSVLTGPGINPHAVHEPRWQQRRWFGFRTH